MSPRAAAHPLHAMTSVVTVESTTVANIVATTSNIAEDTRKCCCCVPRRTPRRKRGGSTSAEPTRSVASSSTAEQSSVVRPPPLEVKLHAKRLRLDDGVWEFYVEYEGEAERRWVTERDSAFPERFRTLIDDLNRAQKETINFGRQKVAWVSIARRISLVPAAIRSHSRRASRSSRASTSKAESSLTASRTGTDPSAGASFGAPGEPSSGGRSPKPSGEPPSSIREEDVTVTETL